ncbi:3-keto-5-aminohexanoate cleavage protein [Pseudomonas aeruginosa]|uniref:3-keto-5-aminohexanoate cleavage protein n=1 Tax=Pseudomonas aeruginosa TaxID=287 RepID=UPI000EB40589|nr:3-keto-5-aminohexanoate cleavage protein [Pseudomonas aeruginosa]MCV3852727.1 3-keto-5-aminohexanoate cleavage protein [Pseudomonas aeruginosa]MCV3858757.1 3-keto-5-aminohexanoate cleavage protein [Pseudomonas aeruginosa]
MSRKVILTCAVTGNAPFNPKHPAMPVTPQQIAEACIEAAHAGASVAHIHVRDPKTGGGSRDPALFKEVVDRVRSSGVDIVLNLTCGLGAFFLPDPEDESRGLPESDVIPVAERVLHLEQCLPEIASLDITTGNQVEGQLEFVYLNTTRTLRAMAKRFQELGVKPELEVFSAGDILFGNSLIADGLIDGTPLFQMVLGVLWGAPATAETMIYQRSLIPANAQWAAFGIARQQMPMVAQSALLGGNVRVGLEDNLYLSRGVFASNGQLVERARTIIECMGMSVATPAEARETMGLRTPR